MRNIKTYEEIMYYNSVKTSTFYSYKIDEFVKVINTNQIYKIKAINTEDVYQPYLLKDDNNIGQYWMSGNLLSYPTDEEMKEYFLNLDQKKYNL
jgi:hypothetical protein